MLTKSMLNLLRRKWTIGHTMNITVGAVVTLVIGGRSMNTFWKQKSMEEKDIPVEMVQMLQMERMEVMDCLVDRVGEEEMGVTVDRLEMSL